MQNSMCPKIMWVLVKLHVGPWALNGRGIEVELGVRVRWSCGCLEVRGKIRPEVPLHSRMVRPWGTHMLEITLAALDAPTRRVEECTRARRTSRARRGGRRVGHQIGHVRVLEIALAALDASA